MSAPTTSTPPSVEGSNGPVDDPTDLSWGDYKAAALATKDEIKRDDVPSMAAGVAFKIFLALFPSLIAAVAIFGFFADPAQLDTYLDRLAGVVPGDALGVIEGALANITETQAGTALTAALAGIAAGLWAASSAAATLVKSLNRAYEVEESRSFLKQRGVAIAITLGLLVTIGVVAALIIAGPQIQNLVVPEQLQGPIANIAFGVAQVVLAVAVLAVFFAFVYWIGPNRELPRWVWMSPGALVGVVGWLVASLAFTIYVQNFGNYDNGTYAGLGSVIVLMLWLQISMMLVLIGGEFNAEVERIKAQRSDVRAGAGMGHMEELPEATDLVEGTLLVPPAGPVPLPGDPRNAAEGRGQVDGVAAGRETPVGDRAQPPPGHGRTDAMTDDGRPFEIDLRDPAPGHRSYERDAGGRALVAGAAVAAAAVAAVVSAVRGRD
jgi:membrane protein